MKSERSPLASWARVPLGALGAAALTVIGAACTDASSTEPPPPAQDAGSDAPVEPPPDACPAGRVELPGGACINAGVPEGACGEGFVNDGADGCTATAPDGTCPDGMMAIPGEAACREIAPCGDGDYGAIPIEASTIYVNQAYAGGGSDGSLTKPYTTVVEAISAAPAGVIIAVAAGTYNGDLTINKPVKIWGRCPSLVEIHGAGATPIGAGVVLDVGADGTELHDVAITSSVRGVALLGVGSIVLDRVWLHKLGRQGMYLLDGSAPSSATLSRSLLDGAYRTGIYAGGSALTVEESVIRSTKPYNSEGGVGIYVESTAKDPPKPTGAAKLVLRRSIIEKNRTIAVHLRGGEGTIESTLIRDTLEEPLTAAFGVGLYVDFDPSTGEAAKASLSTSVIERSIDAGVFIHAADVAIDATVIRDVAAQPGDQRGGRGINIDFDGKRTSNVTIQRSVVERATGSGVFVAASTASLEASVVRDTSTEPDGRFGFGVTTQPDFALTTRAALTMKSCRVERSHIGGIMTFGTDTTIEHTLVSDTLPATDGTYGDGVSSLVYGGLRGACAVTGSHIEKSARAGISNFDSDMSIKDTLLDCNPIHLDGEGEGFKFNDGGANECRCAAQKASCQVLSTKIAPPDPP